MKRLSKKYTLYLSGAVVGGVAGFFYWKNFGCADGSCMITSRPYNSILYFSIMGALLFGMFIRTDKIRN